MITIPRPFLRAFRTLGRKCVAGRPCGPAPPVVFAHDRDAALLVRHAGEVVLTGRVPGPVAPFDAFEIPADVFDAVDTPGRDAVTIAVTSRRAEVRVGDAAEKSIRVKAPAPRHRLPPEPKSLSPVPAAFAEALREAGRTTSCKPGRYDLNRVQVRGDRGDVVASDWVTAYWRTGFRLPFQEAILVPAVPLFGAGQWTQAATVCVGRTKEHLTVRAGPWTAILMIDTLGRFPDVASVLPRTPTPATVDLDPADAVLLTENLPGLPGNADDSRPVTLDLAPGRPAVVRGRDDATGDTAEVVLPRSRVTNGPMRVAVNRAFLLRAVALGCTKIRVAQNTTPVVAAGKDLTWITAALVPDRIVPANAVAPNALTNANPPHSPEDRPAMTLLDAPARPRDRGDSADLNDPLVAAEALRFLLFEATQAATRLVAALKAKSEPSLLPSVSTGLASLTLRP